jgi:hypothetical protein
MLRRVPPAEPGKAWSRRKMLALVGGAALAAVLLVLGLVLTIVYAGRPAASRNGASAAGPAAPGAAGPAAGGSRAAQDVTQQARDALAAAPMPLLDDTAAQPGPVSTHDPGPALVLPKPTTLGPESVATGFPQTPLGAMAQLAAIDQAALQSGSLAGARAVITAWAVSGGPAADSWSGVHALAGFLDAAGLSGGGSPQLALVVTPLMGQVKGSVGPDFTVPCVDYEVDATLAQTARVAVADCQRMVWTGQRWMVGPGAEPADAPSVWPDTDAAIRVGYRDVRRG